MDLTIYRREHEPFAKALRILVFAETAVAHAGRVFRLVAKPQQRQRVALLLQLPLNFKQQ